MNTTAIFVIRLIVAVFLAFILVRIFRPDIHPGFIAILAAFLLGTAYGLEYLRKRRSSDKG